MPRGYKSKFACISPIDQPGYHGSDPLKSLQAAPFGSQANAIWIGYRNNPSRKYLSKSPSLQEVINLCQTNYMTENDQSFPRFDTHLQNHQLVDESGSNYKRVCCAACRGRGGDCEALFLEYIEVNLPEGSKHKVIYLLGYNFHLNGEKLLALVHYRSRGFHFFQKVNGGYSETLALITNLKFGTGKQPITQRTNGYDPDSDSSLSSLESIDEVVEGNGAELAPWSPRIAVRPRPIRVQQESPRIPQPARRCAVVDLTEEEEARSESSSIKQEALEDDPISIPSNNSRPDSREHSSFSSAYAPDCLAEEYGRITTQIFKEYSMRVFDIPEVADLIRRMEQAVKTNDRAALSRTYGALRAYLVSVG